MVEGSSTAYLAVAGGFALPPFMGSLSTYARAGVGGFQGRKLAAGDSLPLVREQAPPGDESKLGQPFDYGSGPIRIVWGPQDDYFSATRPPHLRRRPTIASPRKPIAWASASRGRPSSKASTRGADIISDGIGPGAIQVPGAGLPIVLLGDRQTVGGYSKIATVASVDLPRLGRLLPGPDGALRAGHRRGGREQLRREQETRIQRAIAELQDRARPPGGIDLVRLYEENLIDGIVYERERPCVNRRTFVVAGLVGSSLRHSRRGPRSPSR